MYNLVSRIYSYIEYILKKQTITASLRALSLSGSTVHVVSTAEPMFSPWAAPSRTVRSTRAASLLLLVHLEDLLVALLLSWHDVEKPLPVHIEELLLDLLCWESKAVVATSGAAVIR